MVSYVAESVASAPPRRGLPFAPPAARASSANFVPQVFAGGAISDVDEDAMPVFSPDVFGGSGDEGGEGPSLEDLENQMGGEVSARDSVSTRAAPATTSASGRRGSRPAGDEEESGPAGGTLPALDDLVARLPAEVRDSLEELFRVRFTTVKKLPKKAIQPAREKGRSDAG